MTTIVYTFVKQARTERIRAHSHSCRPYYFGLIIIEQLCWRVKSLSNPSQFIDACVLLGRVVVSCWNLFCIITEKLRPSLAKAPKIR